MASSDFSGLPDHMPVTSSRRRLAGRAGCAAIVGLAVVVAGISAAALAVSLSIFSEQPDRTFDAAVWRRSEGSRAAMLDDLVARGTLCPGTRLQVVLDALGAPDRSYGSRTGRDMEYATGDVGRGVFWLAIRDGRVLYINHPVTAHQWPAGSCLA